VNILIIGAGAVGSLLAHRLASAGHQVVAIGRAPYVRAVNQRGLFIAQDRRVSRGARIVAAETVDPLAGARFDAVLITVKTFDTGLAAVQARPFAEHGVPVVLVQGGVGGVEVARCMLNADELYVGVLTGSVQMPTPGVICLDAEPCGMGLSAVGADGRFDALLRLFAESELAVERIADWRAAQWSGLMVDMIANAVPAILDRLPDELYADARLCDLERDALREARKVMVRLGVELVSLPGGATRSLVSRICMLPAPLARQALRREIVANRVGRPAPLHADLRRDRGKSQVPFLNGAVVRAGGKLGVATPVNEALYRILHGLVRRSIDRDRYRGRIDRLVQVTRGPQRAAQLATT